MPVCRFCFAFVLVLCVCLLVATCISPPVPIWMAPPFARAAPTAAMPTLGAPPVAARLSRRPAVPFALRRSAWWPRPALPRPALPAVNWNPLGFLRAPLLALCLVLLPQLRRGKPRLPCLLTRTGTPWASPAAEPSPRLSRKTPPSPMGKLMVLRRFKTGCLSSQSTPFQKHPVSKRGVYQTKAFRFPCHRIVETG